MPSIIEAMVVDLPAPANVEVVDPPIEMNHALNFHTFLVLKPLSRGTLSTLEEEEEVRSRSEEERDVRMGKMALERGGISAFSILQ